jgi:hypothetical protein
MEPIYNFGPQSADELGVGLLLIIILALVFVGLVLIVM